MVSSASSPPTKIHASRTSSICSVGGDCGAKVCKLLAGSEHHVVDNAVVRVGLYRGLSGLGGDTAKRLDATWPGNASQGVKSACVP